MISSANLCAIRRAESVVAVSVYCLPNTCGEVGFFRSYSQPCTVTLFPPTPRLPKASMEAFAGAELQTSNLISEGWPGTSRGLKLLETRSKMPALSRSFHKVSLKALSRSLFFGSGVEGLKSGTANLTFSTPSRYGSSPAARNKGTRSTEGPLGPAEAP